MLLPDRDDREDALHRAIRPGSQPVQLTRRAALAGAAAFTAFAPSIARAQTVQRVYRLERGNSDIGQHALLITQIGDEVVVEIDIAIRVSLLGITAYRYEMQNEERWRGGEVASIRSSTDSDGEAAFVRATRTGAGLEVDGSTWSGTVPGRVGTTTYWTPAMLQRSVWVSTQGGAPLDITARRTGSAQYPMASGTVPATVWTVGPELPVTLFYTESGEWAGSTFDARGTQVRYIARSLSPALAPIWSET